MGMKKILAILLCVVLACGVLAGCGTKIKSEENGEIGKQAVAIADSFLAGEIDTMEAVDSLDELRQKVVEEDSQYDTLLRAGISHLGDEIVIAKNAVFLDGGNAETKDIIDARNTIADYVGVEKK